MIRTGLRVWSWFLVAVFLGGGLGLPDADALLFHTLGLSSQPDVAHFDLPGGCGAHSEKCALTAAASAPQLGAVGLAAVRVAHDASPHPVFASVPSLCSADRSFLHPSRAPPAPAC
jgi:hypothetical protein